ncbi:hypothetical protein PG993_006472 [Apiospora rasikravindrae]|uniref:F-box domain-containing protein n=1 Tax=Apiospora rasikravindrae TaxID=990691 RepID=A0ABR1T5U2_9PEZI
MGQLLGTLALHPREPTAFARLPNEMVAKIFEQLCFHCQSPSIFPNADTDDVRQRKATLARLCRVSKRFRAIAEPILYHYYATGNCKHFLDDTDPNIRGTRWQGSNDYLLSFASRLVERPDLASKVVSMQLVDHSAAYRKYNEDKNLELLRALLKQSEDKHWLSCGGLSQTIEGWLSDSDVLDLWKQEAHRWVMCLVMVLSTNLRNVLIAVDNNYLAFPAFEEKALPIGRLPSLTHLGMMSCRDTPYHLAAVRGLLASAPKLETIYACDSCHVNVWDSHPQPHRRHNTGYTPIPCAGLKKLVICDLFPPHLEEFLWSIDGLEELEYYWKVFPLFRARLNGVLLQTKDTLKRLCISFLPCHESQLGPEPHFWYDIVDVKMDRIESLAMFSKLEDIAIDFRSLRRESDEDEDDLLVNFLPKTARRLRVSYVVDNMTKSLSKLANTAPDRFPKLESVVIGVTKWPDGISDHVADMRDEVERLFVNKGISFAWREDTFGPCVYTLIPGATKPGLRLLPWKEEDDSAM